MASKTTVVSDVEGSLRRYIATNVLFQDDLTIGDEESFIDSGLMDSTGILELVLFVEETFGIETRDEEVVPENFDSIVKLASYIHRKRGGSS